MVIDDLNVVGMAALDDGTGVNALVDVKGNGGDFKGGVLGLARPLQLRVEVGVVGVKCSGWRRGRYRASPGRQAGC